MTAALSESFHTVRAYECDYYGHVNNAIYLNYLEFARMETLDTKGISLSALKNNGFTIVIRRVDITYRAPAVVEDRISIKTYMKSHSQVSGTFHQKISRVEDQAIVAEADVTWVVTNLKGRPVPIPDFIREPFDIPLRRKKR